VQAFVLTHPYFADFALTADLHRGLQFVNVELVIGKDARNIVERRKPDTRSVGNQQGVIFRMRVSARDT
jgi:hypothetical protein